MTRVRRLLKWLGIILVVLVVLLLIAAGGGYWVVTRSLPQTSGTLSVPGLKAQVQVVRDPMGMPHIYAANVDDLFFAQGYVQAQDRLWQMEFFRHIGEGRLSELFGSSVLDQDKYLRTIGLGRAAQADWQNASDDEKRSLTAFAAGVNAFIQSHQDTLPVEFTILGVKPAPWQPVDSMAWGKVLAFNLNNNGNIELLRSQLLQKFTAAQLQDLWPSYPSTGPFVIPTQVKDYSSAAYVPSNSAPVIPIGKPDLAALDALDRKLGARGGSGSNNWVVDGAKSTTGKPILANDPHLSIQMPSIWYEVGLHCQPVSADCPYNVVGVSFSAAPGIVIGHNDRVAWGVTNVGGPVGPAAQDFFIEKDNPNNPNQYEFQGQWQDYQIDNEVLHVKGGADQTIQVKISRHGPVMTPVLDGITQTLALEWTATHERSHLQGAVLQLDRAHNFDEFRTALKSFNVPSQNFVYADVDGNIGYQMPGQVPTRAKGDGSVPVPGWTGEYEWTGYIPFDDLPFVFNPSTHYIATANNQIVPSSYKYLIGNDWSPPWRVQRISDMLQAKDKLSPEDFQAIQGDVTSLPMQQLQPYLVKLSFDQPQAAQSLEYIQTWDGKLTMDSVAASILEATYQRIMKNTFGNKMDKDTFQSYYSGSLRTSEIGHQAILNLLTQPNSSWWDDPTTPQHETRDDILKKSYEQAVSDLAQQLGNSPADWHWSRLHTATFASPLGSVKPLNLLFNFGPVPVPGDSFTVDNSIYSDPNGYSIVGLSSMRLIMNTANWDQSYAILTTGESGQPFSSHYTDMVVPWRDVHYAPFYFTRDALMQAQVTTLTLNP